MPKINQKSGCCCTWFEVGPESDKKGNNTGWVEESTIIFNLFLKGVPNIILKGIQDLILKGVPSLA